MSSSPGPAASSSTTRSSISRKLDAVRVAPGVMRSFEAGSDGDASMLAFGAHHEGDGEIVQGWWAD